MKLFVRCALTVGLVLTIAGCNDTRGRIGDYLVKAQAFTEEGNMVKARIELQNALKLAPGDPKINLALAKNEDAVGDIESAMSHYLRAALPDANLIEAQLRVIEVLIDSNRFADALGRVNSTLGTAPNNADAIALRADIEERQGQFAAARTDAENALQRDAKNSRALAVSALLRLRANDGPGALALIDRGLQTNGDDLRLLQVRAAIFLTLEQPDKAITAFQSIVRTAPRNVLAHRALAELEARNGRFDAALDAFKKAVEADPTDEAMQIGLISFLESQKKASEVVDRLDTLIAANPKLATYDLVLAEFYRQAGNIATVRDVLTKAAARLGDAPSGLSIKVALAKVDLTAGANKAAADQIASVLATDGQNKEALLVRASMAMQESLYDAAIMDFLIVVRGDPVNGPAFEALSAAYLAKRQTANAIDAMKRAVAVTPGDSNAELKLAVMLQSAGSVDAAKDLLTRILVRKPSFIPGWDANAKLAIDRQDWVTATRSLAKLRELNATGPAQAVDAQMKLARGDFAGAFTGYQSAINSGVAFDTNLMSGFARAAVGSKNINDAVALLTSHAPSLTGEPLQVLWTLIMTLQADAGHVDKAEDAFKAAVRAAPKVSGPYKIFVQILIARQNYGKARTVINEGLVSGMPKADLLILLGGIDDIQKNYASALAYFKQALDIDPTSVEAANNYGSLLADQSPKDIEALTAARSRLAPFEASNKPVLVDTIAWLDYRLGRFPEARLLLSRINAAQSTNPQIRFHLAAVLLAAGDKAGGLALLDSVKGLNFPGSDEVRTLSDT